ncbi:MAG TPA: hypothetical protein VK909_09020 [Anaerolineales bacterium]|nr:hypothetical protein [Anaerolineales bacterium]
MKRTFRIILVVLTIFSLSLSAYALMEKTNDRDDGDNGDRVTICHKTGSANNPYVEITVSVNGASHGHSKHAGDLIPAPAGGCPGTANGTGEGDTEDNDETANQITICHKTGSSENPYEEIMVSVNGATHGHGKHAGDLIPAPEGGCPTTITDTDIPVR